MTRRTFVTIGRVASLPALLLVACGESSERDGACPGGTHEDHGTCVADTLADAATDSVVQPPSDAATDSVVQPPSDATTDKPADEGACAEVNGCGGCSALAHGLGEPCGTGGSYVCNGTDDVTCETSVAPPAQAAGYQLVFADEFDALDMSPNKLGDYKWYRAIPVWDLGAPPAASISVANSALTLTWTPDQGTYLTAVSTCAKDASHHRAWRHGYIEVRMRWDVAIGAWPAIWMMPVQGVLAEGEHGEIDNFEGQGGESDWFFGTIHDWQANGTITDRACHVLAPAGTDYAQYHTYGLLWTPGQMTWYFDNQALGSVGTHPIFEAEDYYLILSMIEGSNWTYGSLTDVTASSIAMSVDWVRVWQQ